MPTCYSTFTWRQVTLPFLALFIAQSFIVPPFLTNYVTSKLPQHLTLIPNTIGTQKFIAPTFHPVLTFTLFSITNPEELSNIPNTLPKLATLPKFTILVTETRLNTHWNKDHTELLYIDCPILQYQDATMESFAKNTIITVLDPKISILAHSYHSSKPNSIARDSILEAMIVLAKTTNHGSVFTNTTIHSYLFDPPFGILKSYNCSKSKALQDNLYMGVNTGKLRKENIGKMTRVINETHLTKFRIPSPIQGYYGMSGIDRLDGTQGEKTLVFDMTLQRHKTYQVQIDVKEISNVTNTRLGIPITKYIHTTEDRLCGGAATLYYQDDCRYVGTYNLTSRGFPSVISSSAYFFDAPVLAQQYQHILRPPDAATDSDWMLIEKLTGVIVSQKKSNMLSFTLKPLPLKVVLAFNNATALSNPIFLAIPSCLETQTQDLNVKDVADLHLITVLVSKKKKRKRAVHRVMEAL